ncbi:MAG: hypothetical protein ACOVN7_15085 [Rubrivivax sp.]|jgi:hypothetical protein
MSNRNSPSKTPRRRARVDSLETSEAVKAPKSPSVSSAAGQKKRPSKTGGASRPGKSAVASPAGPEVAIFQIFFEQSQRSALDSAFIPLDNAGHADPLFEFSVFERLAAEEGVRLSPLWGAVSWRFAAKTGMDGRQWLDQIRQHPGFDLYFCNPSPENEGLYASPWQQGMAKHPGLRDLAAQMFSSAGLDPRELDDIVPSPGFSSCNYFVGTPQFWNAYIPFVRNVIDLARKELPAPVLALLDSNKADPMGLHPGATYWPFIVERLFTVFLKRHAGVLKVHKVALPKLEAQLNPHVKRLREMKDVAHRTRSQWLYGCWLSYRNLYLLQVAGKEWCARHLPLLVSKEVRFW